MLPYSYLWSTGDTLPSIFDLEAGQYELTLTDARGCEIIRSATIGLGEDFVPEGSLVTQTVDCNGDSTTLSYLAQENYDFLWSNGAATITTTFSSGNHSLTITNAVGCVYTLPFFVGNEPNLALTPVVDCGNSCDTRIKIWANVAFGKFPYTYSWSNGLSGPQYSSIEANPDEIYQVTVTDASGCTVSATNISTNDCVEVDERLRLRVYFECLSDSINSLTSATLHAEVLSDGIPPYIFEWNTGQVDTAFYRSSIDFSRDLDSLFLLEVKVTDALGNTTLWNAQPEEYGCGPDSNFIAITAPDTIVQPGQSFAYPIYIEGGDSLLRGVYTIDWDDCIVQVDSIVFFPFSENSFSFPASMIFNNTYELYWGEEFLGLLDTTISHMVYFTAKEDAVGVSPFLFSVNEVPILTGNRNSFFRPQHGSITVAGPQDLVRAGDANNNGIVNHFDLLNTGIAFGELGPERRLAITDGSNEYGRPWQQFTPKSGLDYKFIDANGDGIIDQKDHASIQANWGLVSNELTSVTLSEIINTAPPLQILNDSIYSGQWNELEIGLGTADNTVDEAYGIAFSLRHSITGILANENPIQLSQSWLFDETDLTIAVVDQAVSSIQVALSRTTVANKEGYGSIAKLVVWVPENAAGFVDFNFEDVALISKQEKTLAIQTLQQSLPFSNVISSNHTLQLQHLVQLTPNPAHHQLRISVVDLVPEEIQINSIDGRTLIQLPFQNNVNISDLQSGIYFLQLKTTEGVVVKKWIKF